MVDAMVVVPEAVAEVSEILPVLVMLAPEDVAIALPADIETVP